MIRRVTAGDRKGNTEKLPKIPEKNRQGKWQGLWSDNLPSATVVCLIYEVGMLKEVVCPEEDYYMGTEFRFYLQDLS